MKKILMSSVVLTVFSISILIFQMSCKKDANAQTGSNVPTQLNKIIYTKRLTSTTAEIWIANYDGTNQTKVNIVVPAGIMLANARLSPDGQTIFFEGVNTSTFLNDIYSCKIDGSNVQKIVDGSTATQGILLGGAY
jgi:hypothetical protein